MSGEPATGGGPMPPYGTAIRSAIERSDVLEMKAVALAARKALFPIEFEPVSEDNRADVLAALRELERAIQELS